MSIVKMLFCSIVNVILLYEKFLQFYWLRAVVFQLNLKYKVGPRVEIVWKAGVVCLP